MKDFKYGGPIEAELFYNREQEVKFLLQKLTQIRNGIKHNYALVGPRRIGKSSILNILKMKIVNEGVIPVFIDCEGREISDQTELTLETLLSAWSGSVIDAYIENAGLKEKIKIKMSSLVVGAKDRIIAALSEVLGKVSAMEIKAIRDYLSFRIEFEKKTRIEKPDAKELVKLFESTIDLVEQLGKEEKVFFVVMLDEFQNLAKYKKPINFLSAFRRHLQAQSRASYLFTGSNIGMMENILMRKPFGGHIPIEWISVFEKRTAENFLKTRFKELKRDISDDALKEIIGFTEGHPAYLNWFGEQCCRQVRENKKINSGLIKELEKKIFEREGLAHVFDEDLRKVSSKRGKIFRTFVEMNAHELESPTEISQQIPQSTATEIITYLVRLEQRGFVKRVEEGKYIVIDQMLKKYIKEKIHVT